MVIQPENPTKQPDAFADAMMKRSEERQEMLEKTTDDLRLSMEKISTQVRDLILIQPPVQLLGYMSVQFHMGILAGLREKGDDYRPDKELIKKFQLAMEFAHAVWAGHADLKPETEQFDEALAKKLFQDLDELERATMVYCIASSAGNRSEQSSKVEFHAKSSWVLIRGHRYQLLEEEFFKYVLAPHDAALRKAYGMGANDIAASVQSLTNAMRTGMQNAAMVMQGYWDKAKKLADKSGEEMDTVVEKMRIEDPDYEMRMSDAIKTMFYGGTSNLSKHSKFSATLLEDISYVPGGNTTFFADGKFKGTPLRTLPARVRPGIKLGQEYYCTDAQFVRDSLYRSIQRGLIARDPAYKIQWDTGQKEVTENAYPAIFSAQFAGAQKWTEVFIKDPDTGQWAETDLVMRCGDVLLVVEAKAGVMAMHSPATDFDKHERTIRKLIIEAYIQCKRFIEYLASAPEVAIYNRIGGQYVELAKLRQKDFRLVLPIGLTVEAFTPFSAMCKELAEIAPIIGKHAFVSMSVDDLFVLNRFLPTTGQLLHYLEVRQQVAEIEGAMIYDEIEHLGSYISDNRFDQTLREQLQEADMILWDSFGDVVDQHFETADFDQKPTPQQSFPVSLADILTALDRYRPPGWLKMDGIIRDMSGEARTKFADIIRELLPTLAEHPRRRVLFGSETAPLQVWLCREYARPVPSEIKFYAEVAALATGAAKVTVLRVSYGDIGITDMECLQFGAPTIVQMDYGEIKAEAGRQRAKFVKFDKNKNKKNKKGKTTS